MDLLSIVKQAYLEATGDSWTSTVGDDDWIRMVSYIQLNLNIWASETGADWESLYSPKINAGLVSATDTFSLPAGLIKVSNKAHDYIYILSADGKVTTRYESVPGPQLKMYSYGGKAVFVAGVNQLIFSQAFKATDPQIGGTLYVPGYSYPAKPENQADIVAIDDPSWLIFMAAQEWAQADTTLVQNVPSLIAKANDRMNAMKLNNSRMKTMSSQVPLTGAARGDTF